MTSDHPPHDRPVPPDRVVRPDGSGPAEAGPLGRGTTLESRLRRLGFTDVDRAVRSLADRELQRVCGDLDAASPLLSAFEEVADPDLALIALTRLAAAVHAHPDPRLGAELAALLADEAPQGGRARLLAVLGASVALGDELVRRPVLLRLAADTGGAIGVDSRAVRAELLRAVEADPDAETPVAGQAAADPVAPTVGTSGRVDAMRRAYRARLLRIAMADLVSTEPLSVMPAVAAALADLAAAALEAALAIARSELADHGRGVRIAVLGMGKCGGRELNYVSDVDVIYVVEPAEGFDEDHATSVGARLAASLGRACGSPSGEPVLWPVDAALRPEGKNGPLVRTLASHVAYYERWAKTWEFQALLKARPVAGDAALGRAYLDRIEPMVWSAVTRENFVEDSRAMRRRVEEHVPAQEADRQLKLGQGGLRDVEFTVQLLQLVHGRSDPGIRSSNTLTALAALAAAGYVGREHAAQLAVCYRLLRAMEHRLQLHRLRRTHLMPTTELDLRRLARSVGMRPEGAEGLLERWRTVRREVRSLHEALFYRPLLPATAQLSTEEASLAPDAAQARLAAIGYRDPAGAMRHIAALTEGVSRRAAIQRQLLPVMLGWFAEGADPDGGLLAFRKLSDELGTTHWYLKLLRDSGSAAHRLARLLSTSRYMADALGRSPESVTWLADDADLAPREPGKLEVEAAAVVARASDPSGAATALRALRRRELARCAAAELLGVAEPEVTARGLSQAADQMLVGGLHIAEEAVAAEARLDERPATMLVVAMGRLGGQEMGYASDADVLFVYEPREGASDATAQSYAVQVATRLRAVLGSVGPEPSLQVDADLRPEGRQGPLVRSLDSYAEYYERWAEVWERQALLRARPVAGDPELAARFVALVDPLRHPEEGLDRSQIREIRRIKARVEAERLPRGTDPARHLKLGRGAISDVEWTVQLIQLLHAGREPGLRTTGTLPALRAAAEAGILAAADAQTLRAAWSFASRLRDALVLWSGRTGGSSGDILPDDVRSLTGLARVLGYPSGAGTQMEEDYLRAARRARAVVERVFYGS